MTLIGMRLLFACTHPVSEEVIEFSDIVPTLSANLLRPTAVIQWETELPEVGWLEYQYDGSPELKSAKETTENTSHLLQLAGVPPGSGVRWRAAWPIDGGKMVTDWFDWTVADFVVPPNAPTVEVHHSDDPGYLAITDLPHHVLWIVDQAGTPVWWQVFGEEVSLERVRMQGQTVWYSYFGGNKTRIGSINLDGTGQQEEGIPHHHDFLRLEDRLVTIQYASGIGPNGKEWTGDQLVEIEGGETKILWSTFDFVDFDQHGGRSPFGTIDWTHCNGLFYEPEEDAYWMSCKQQYAIYVIRRDGTLLHVIGGPQTTMEVQGPRFKQLHAPFVKDGYLYLYNNDNGQAEVYHTNFANNSYWQVNTFKDPDYKPWVHGNVTPTECGGLMVAFGHDGGIEVVDQDGKVALHLQVPEVAYVEYLPTLSGPL